MAMMSPAAEAPAAAAPQGPAPTEDGRIIPSAALWLGYGGVIPFAGLAAGLWLFGPHGAAQALFALAAYGAVILSFLGGVVWGAAVIAGQAGRIEPSRRGALLGLSVLPSLAAWAALLLVWEAAPFTLGVLMLCFAAQFAADRRLTLAGLFPPWFGRLRARLSLAVVACLGLALLRVATLG